MGLLYVAVLFTALHLGYRSLLEAAFVFGVALLFGLFTLRRGSLLGVSLSHGLINISMYLLFPFLLAQPTRPAEPVSPLPATGGFLAPIPSAPQTAPKTGGSTGLEYTVNVPLALQGFEVERLPSIVVAATPTQEPSSPSATPTPAGEAGQPPVEPSPAACGPPAGWVTYTVRPGDTLAALSRAYNVSVDQLRQANCLPASNLIVAGQRLYVPFTQVDPTAVILPTDTPLPTPSETLPLTPTFTPLPPTVTPLTPTVTPEAPTATLEPPTATLELPTDTLEPPPDTPEPEPTEPRETPTVAPTEGGG
jgi:LysM repeat protein